jgi:hypothetical protein
MPKLLQSAYVPNKANKLMSLSVAIASAYMAWRAGTNNQYITQARVNSYVQQGTVDAYTANTGKFDPEAPLLSEVANWWRLRQREWDTMVQTVQASAKGVFYWLGDAMLPLATFAAANYVGFRKEWGTAFKTAYKYLPKANWIEWFNIAFKGLGHVAGGALALPSKLLNSRVAEWIKHAPIPAAILGGLGFVTLQRLVDVYNGTSQHSQIQDDFTKYHQ